MRYLVYARKSSEEKTKQVQSIEDQISALQPLIQQGNLHVTAVLTESKSAQSPGRPVFNQMLATIQKGEADAILCWHLNRLTRNEIDSGTIRWMLRQGIIKEIVTPGRTYRPEDNTLVTAVESAMGEQFLVELKASTRRGVLSKIEKGWFPGHVPQGYKNDVLTHTIVRDPERWALVRAAWTEMLTGRYSVPLLAEKMSREWGYANPRKGQGMARTTMYNILCNPFYTGVFVFQGQVYPGKHEPMVTHAEFAEVQRLLGRSVLKPRRTKREFAFSGLILCGHCGRAVCGDRKRKVIKDSGEERFYTYYACGQGSKCNRHRLREEDVETRITEWLAAVRLPDRYLTWAEAVIQRERAEAKQAEAAVHASQIRALAETQEQRDELITLRARRLIDDASFARLTAKLAEERLTVLAEQEKAAVTTEQSGESALNVASFCVHAERAFTHGSVSDKGKIARQLGASYRLTKGELHIAVHDVLGLVREHNETAVSSGASLEPMEIGSGSRETAFSSLVCKEWGDLLDKTRTKAGESGVSFPAWTLP